MMNSYKEKDLTYFMSRFPAVANLILDSDYISSCNFSMNFFPVVLNADNELWMSMRIPITSYLSVKSTLDGGVVFDTSIFYDAYADTIHERPISKSTQSINNLTAYILKYLQKHNVNPNVIIRIFMARDRDVGFWYKSFWVTMLAYRMLVVTGQISEHGKRDTKQKDLILILVKKIYSLVEESMFKRGTFLWPLRFEHTHPVYFTNQEIVNLYQYTSDVLPVDIVVLNFGSWYEWNTSMQAIKEFHRSREKHIKAVWWQYQESYLNNFAYCLKAEFINAYEKLVTNQNGDMYIKRLMTTIDNINSFAKIVEWPNDMLEEINRLIKEHKWSNNEHIAVLPVTSNQYADNIMIIANKNKSRKTIATVIEKLNAKNACAIEYVSRIDKDYKTWIQIEHYPTRGIYLPGYEWYDCTVRSPDGKVVYKKYGDIHTDYKDYLVVDSISNKIYKDGNSIDSAMLPSQVYTISILKTLLDKQNKRISNKVLPASAYSKSMNQFSGKILSPLKKLTTTLLWTPIQIHITWSLYDYEIKLTPSQDKFVFIEKKV